MNAQRQTVNGPRCRHGLTGGCAICELYRLQAAVAIVFGEQAPVGEVASNDDARRLVSEAKAEAIGRMTPDCPNARCVNGMEVNENTGEPIGQCPSPDCGFHADSHVDAGGILQLVHEGTENGPLTREDWIKGCNDFARRHGFPEPYPDA